ncbi:hypothetical protein F3I27_16145 [Pantoea sp. Bo_2]|uniref:hypothetical protein n=1 Tax=unclassified Pantoea TaxID=2630326 RepID=UPI001232C1E0|nr:MULTISPECIES: hypothetical protein [unclassified Pantoea]KAA5943932.1 hypothetical protein F3I57_13685 [Pantoea sp. VH_3]KAA5951417.1 hypothetical protein F3I56_14200 [Pantoea sp. VH_25]KAA5981349.1 hypothetical protein F3I48_14720 [Pantoea sp. M_3]KAA6044106.1 hypothetical protein F3I36_15200 [Pantoea sp. FN_2b]KAA6048960.1 hypothetical protein F3I34_16150 [Pantoea sp. Bo_5]
MSFYDTHDETTPLAPVETRYQELRALLIAEWLARPDLPAIKAQLAQARKRSSPALLRRKLKELNARETQEAKVLD